MTGSDFSTLSYGVNQDRLGQVPSYRALALALEILGKQTVGVGVGLGQARAKIASSLDGEAADALIRDITGQLAEVDDLSGKLARGNAVNALRHLADTLEHADDLFQMLSQQEAFSLFGIKFGSGPSSDELMSRPDVITTIGQLSDAFGAVRDALDPLGVYDENG